MRNIIIEKLQSIQAEYNIHILYAFESGSRAWGFPSPDSDFDVRFIYLNTPDWYLSINESKDSIEFIEDKLLDFNGWDVRKALRLLYSSNLTPFEWMQSNIVYMEKSNFKQALNDIAGNYFIPKAAIHHYLGLTKKTMNTSFKSENVKIKKYFYALRPVLCAKWIMENNSIPPLSFHKLFPVVNGTVIQDKIVELLEAKEKANEGDMVKSDQLLNQFIEDNIKNCSSYADSLESSRNDVQPLNIFFRNLLKQTYVDIN